MELVVFSLFLLSFCSFLRSSEITLKEGLIVIPGLSFPSRISVLANNLRLFENKFSNWDCIVYLSKSRDDPSFWNSNINDLEYISEKCSLIDHPHHYFPGHLHLLQPSLIQYSYTYIFMLSENCELYQGKYIEDLPVFKLEVFLKNFQFNNLTIASPRLFSSQKNLKNMNQGFRKVMYSNSPPGTTGFVTHFLSLNALILTIPAYKAFWELISPDINPYGWGYDLWYDTYASQRIAAHKMGVITTVGAVSLEDIEPIDNLSKEKWDAQIGQEQFYEEYYGVSLKTFRKNFKDEIPSEYLKTPI